MELNSRWIEYKDGELSFDKTENYIFAKGSCFEKRIGDMDRNELIRVIAMGYHERERLAIALNTYAEYYGLFEPDFSEDIDLAQLIVNKRQPKQAIG